MIVNLSPKVATCATFDPFLLSNLKGLTIQGQVKQENIPLACRVRLHEKTSGRLIAEIATDPNGFYEFDHLNQAKFYVVAHHPASQFNAVIQDNVVPK